MTAEEQLARFGQLPIPVEAELGKCTMQVRAILSLRPGSILRLDNSVGSKVSVLAGGAPFCSGDMMRVGNAVAVRVTDFESRKQD